MKTRKRKYDLKAEPVEAFFDGGEEAVVVLVVGGECFLNDLFAARAAEFSVIH